MLCGVWPRLRVLDEPCIQKDLLRSNRLIYLRSASNVVDGILYGRVGPSRGNRFCVWKIGLGAGLLYGFDCQIKRIRLGGDLAAGSVINFLREPRSCSCSERAFFDRGLCSVIATIK